MVYDRDLMWTPPNGKYFDLAIRRNLLLGKLKLQWYITPLQTKRVQDHDFFHAPAVFLVDAALHTLATTRCPVDGDDINT